MGVIDIVHTELARQDRIWWGVLKSFTLLQGEPHVKLMEPVLKGVHGYDDEGRLSRCLTKKDVHKRYNLTGKYTFSYKINTYIYTDAAV